MASIFPEQRGHLESPVVPRNDRPEDGSSTPGDFSVTLPGIVYLLGSQVWLPFWRQGAVLKGPVRSTVSFDASVTCFLAAVTHPCVAQEGRVYSVSQLRVPSIGRGGHGGRRARQRVTLCTQLGDREMKPPFYSAQGMVSVTISSLWKCSMNMFRSVSPR